MVIGIHNDYRVRNQHIILNGGLIQAIDKRTPSNKNVIPDHDSARPDVRHKRCRDKAVITDPDATEG